MYDFSLQMYMKIHAIRISVEIGLDFASFVQNLQRVTIESNRVKIICGSLARQSQHGLVHMLVKTLSRDNGSTKLHICGHQASKRQGVY